MYNPFLDANNLTSDEDLGLKLMAEDIKSIVTSNGIFEPLGLDPNELINFLRFIDNEKAKHLIEVYDSLSARDKNNLDLDKLADKAGYSRQKLRSIIISALIEYEIDCTSLLLAVGKATLVSKSLEVALLQYSAGCDRVAAVVKPAANVRV
jgi:serine/threonine protein kinase HipA of HipAB toxin-antitoxin module